MRTVKDVYNVCQKTVNRLDRKDIDSKYDLAFKLPKALGNDFTVLTSKGQLSITLSDLELNTNEPLLIIKTTFTKEHGLKHCVVKLNPRLKDLGLRFDTSLEDARLFVKCLYKQDSQGFIQNQIKDLKLRQRRLEADLKASNEFLDNNIHKITDRTLQTSIRGEYKQCL